MRKNKGKAVLTGLLALVFLLSGGMSLRQQLQYQRLTADRDEAARTAGLGERTAVPALRRPEFPPETLPEELSALAEIDLDALRAVNGDVAGWIEIPGTALSYPLVQGSDNEYYLTHNWKKEPSSGGAVFLEWTNRRDLKGFHTIAYAHRMNNDTMFGTLKYYRDAAFWAAHPSIYVVQDEAVARYDIFSAEEVPVTGIVYRLDLEERQLEEAFLDACLEGSVIDTGIVPEKDTKVLTLSTCTGHGHETRWVVHGALAARYSRQTGPLPEEAIAGLAAAVLSLLPGCPPGIG